MLHEYLFVDCLLSFIRAFALHTQTVYEQFLWVLFLQNLQEEAGVLKFVCASNDGVDQHMIW